MKNSRHTLVLGLAFLLGALVSSCASGPRPTVAPPTYLAQSAAADCRHGDSSMVCCIKKFPRTAMESCGAAATEVAEVLTGAKILNEAAHQEEDNAAEALKESAEDDPDEGWKEHCRENYVLCRDQKKPRWEGDCYACFRYCEGQHEWPFHLCRPRG